MRKGPLCLMLLTLSIGAPAHGEENPAGASEAGQIIDLQQRLQASEQQRADLQSATGERESAQLSRLRLENQRLKLQLKEAQAGNQAPRLLTEQQQWFVTGAGVALFALLCGIFASGARRKRRQWLN